MKKDILDIISGSAVKLLSPLTIDETEKIVVSEAKKIIGGEFGTIVLKKNGKLERVYADATFLRLLVPRKSGTLYKTFASKKPRVIQVKEEGLVNEEILKHGIVTMIQLPLIYRGKATGVLGVYSKNKLTFSQSDLSLLSIFASLASMAIMKTQLYAQTKSALETRDLFISLASHELRTPLTSINGYIQLLAGHIKDKSSLEGKWVAELVEESGRLTSLITELLEINKIKQGQLHYNLRECSIEDFVDISVKRYKFVNPNREVIMTRSPQATKAKVIGDSSKLIQMFTALLSNADKFSPSDKPIRVEIDKDKKLLSLRITDQGEGIERSEQHKIFEGFYKGSQTEAEGLGVGLLLTKHIVQYHHGEISIKSEKNRGTMVRVDLPTLL